MTLHAFTSGACERCGMRASWPGAAGPCPIPPVSEHTKELKRIAKRRWAEERKRKLLPALVVADRDAGRTFGESARIHRVPVIATVGALRRAR